MINLPRNVEKLIGERLKIGNNRPVATVEVDRFSFIPGDVETFDVMRIEKVKIVETVVSNGGYSITGDEKITFPIPGYNLSSMTSPFGGARNHGGIDLQGKFGGDVVSAWGGKVVNVNYNNTLDQGRSVNIMHSGNIMTKYFHLNSISVNVGDDVQAGQKVGAEGNSGHVFSNGVFTGNSPSGAGHHLHFEVWEGATGTTGGNGHRVDPKPYLQGVKKLPGPSTNINPTSSPKAKAVSQTDTTHEGLPGKIWLNEKFTSKQWYNRPEYYLEASFKEFTFPGISSKGTYARLEMYTYTGNPDNTYTFKITVPTNIHPSKFDLGFRTNIKTSEGDWIKVKVNGSEVRSLVKGFDTTGDYHTLNNIYLPPQYVQIQIDIHYGGKYGQGTTSSKIVPKFIELNSMLIQEIVPTDGEDKSISDNPIAPKPSKPTVTTQESWQFIEHNDKVNLETGTFVYMDTIKLENVQSIDLSSSLESESAEAKITITNPNGYYSPDYNPYRFPELTKRINSPFSFKLPGGYNYGVLSENTPIRIYMGYGNNTKGVRVFTGLIDTVDMSGGDASLSISARDMYKKISNKVLLNRKEYPHIDKASNPFLADNLETDTSNLTRYNQILQTAWDKSRAWGLNADNCYYFMLAVTKHETEFGTTGRGRESSGSFICGYGAYDNSTDWTYSGIDKQMYYTAKRIYDAMQSRGRNLNTLDDVKYFFNGGDKGKAYTWATDTNWPYATYECFKEIIANKKKYAPPSMANSNKPPSSGVPPVSNGKTPTYTNIKYPNKVLKRPMNTDSNVKKVQQNLLDLGYRVVGKADGSFGLNTESGVKAFQKAKGLTTDGKVGLNTWNALFNSYTSSNGTDDKAKANDKKSAPWLKTAVVQDLIGYAGMYGWRSTAEDTMYPDSYVEESYLIELKPREGSVVKALSEEDVTNLQQTLGDDFNIEDRFMDVPLSDLSVRSVEGWMNPMVEEYGKTFTAYDFTVGDAIRDVIKDTNYRSYVDRYGTYRLEEIDYFKPIVGFYAHDNNLVQINKTFDYSRARSHIVISEEKSSTYDAHFIDKELLLELKGEIRTTRLVTSWADTDQAKKEVARRLFFDMKRICRSLQIAVPGDPSLDILDRVTISDMTTSTNEVYTIKGIKHSYSKESGFLTHLELMWSHYDSVEQIPGPGGKLSIPKPLPEPKPTPAPPTPGKIQTFNSLKTSSWRDKGGWRNDNQYIYQGEWDNSGNHIGLITFDYKKLRESLKGKSIKKVRLYLERVNKGGISGPQKPTFYLHNHTVIPSGKPTIQTSSAFNSPVGWARGDGKWVDLPTSFIASIRDGKATGIATYAGSDGKPYMYFYGGTKIKLEISVG